MRQALFFDIDGTILSEKTKFRKDINNIFG